MSKLFTIALYPDSTDETLFLTSQYVIHFNCSHLTLILSAPASPSFVRPQILEILHVGVATP